VFRLKRQIRLDQLRLIQTFKISTIHPNRESRSRPRRKGVGNYAWNACALSAWLTITVFSLVECLTIKGRQP
jgi:hypothetical protein